VAALIARNQTIEMPYHFNLALDNGVRPNEISEIITHLAFYSGWANAMSAVAVAKDVFVAQIPYHLNRAMDNGLTQAQAAEAITHLAFYVGWPNVFSALPVAKGVFDNRPK
jgi:alkylhydroperoxidase/carboxymuconolactone decarboxylase family protein YurZ